MPDNPIPTKLDRYVRRLFERYDTNGDGVIDAAEQRQMQGNPRSIDYDADGQITREELAAFTADFGRHRRMRLTGSMVDEAVAELPPLYIPTAERDAMAAAQQASTQTNQQASGPLPPGAASGQTEEVTVALIDDGETAETETESDDEPEAKKATDESDEETKPDTSQKGAAQPSTKRFVTPPSRLAGLPDWFLTADKNGDGQLTTAEFAPNSDKTRLTQFSQYDRNKDGVLTPQEIAKQK